MPQFFVYILRCADGTFYTGWTLDLNKRLQQHNRGLASKYTRARLPVFVVYSETFATKGEAMKREIALKKLRRQKKLQLVASDHGSTV